ncbi:hypothetical protein D3C72_2153350 [compost metagenome]
MNLRILAGARQSLLLQKRIPHGNIAANRIMEYMGRLLDISYRAGEDIGIDPA